MNKVFIFFALLLFIACSNEKNKLYDQAIEHVRSKLKAPSTAKFEDYKEENVTIALKAGKDQPLYETLKDDFDKMKEGLTPKAIEDIMKEYTYDLASVKGKYEAQNVLGVFLAGKYIVYLKRYEYSFCKGKCEWKIIGEEIE